MSNRANAAEIRAAYRLKAKLFHPDLHAGDKEAEKRIKEINHAYAILSDSGARAAYDFKLMLPRIRARRRGAVAGTAALAVFMITIVTISVEWRRQPGNLPFADHQAKLEPGSSGGRRLIAEISDESHANVQFEERHTKDGGSSNGFIPPELTKPLKTETAAALPPPNLESEPVAKLPPLPVPAQEADPQTSPARDVPIEGAARQAQRAAEAPRRRVVSRDTHSGRAASAKNQEKVAGRDNNTKFARVSLQTAQRDFEREPRLVSSSASALAWPSADEPFVNMGARGR